MVRGLDLMTLWKDREPLGYEISTEIGIPFYGGGGETGRRAGLWFQCHNRHAGSSPVLHPIFVGSDKMILAFTGAGISKASGIPTFDEQGDMRKKLDRYFSYTNPTEFQEIIKGMSDICNKAQPNDAHLALSEYDVPIITMNIDGLHHKAGSDEVLPIHGTLPHIVLYGDPAPLYEQAYNWVYQLRPGDTFLIVGTSFYTNISEQLRICAMSQGADIVIINNNAEKQVREYLENHTDRLESYEEFMAREPDI